VPGAMLLAGCFSYLPVETAPPGATVRVRIPVTSAVADPNAPPRTVSVEGTVLESGDTLVLATETRREYGAFREIVQFDTVRLAPDQRSSVELQGFSKGKSIALGVGIAAGVTGLALVAFGGVFGGDPPGPPDGPTPAVVVSRSLLSALLGVIGR
jgi:hypothetical protein